MKIQDTTHNLCTSIVSVTFFRTLFLSSFFSFASLDLGARFSHAVITFPVKEEVNEYKCVSR